MTLRLGDLAPDFEALTTDGPIRFHDWAAGKWVVFFSHPRDYTPVCTTELGYTAKLKGEFEKRNVKAIALSVDGIEDHRGWAKDIAETQGCELNFPVIADPTKTVANLYDMIHPNASDTFTVRSVFIIDPNKKIRLTLTYPASTGRNFDEILRVIDSLQLTDGYKVATPVVERTAIDAADRKAEVFQFEVPGGNLKPGLYTCQVNIIDEVVTVKDEDAAKLFPGGWKTVKPYLRLVPAPDKK